MNTSQILDLLKTNREYLQRNSDFALNDLHDLCLRYANHTDEEVQLSLAFNQSLAQIHFYSQYAKAIENSLQIIEKFKDSKNLSLLERHHWVTGHAYAHIGEHTQAENYLLRALQLLESFSPVPYAQKTNVLYSLAINNHYGGGNAKISIEYLQQILEMPETATVPSRKASSLNGIGNFCMQADNYDEARSYFLSALKIYEEDYDLLNMAACYSNLGGCYLKMVNLEMAETNLNKALDLRIKVGTPEHLAISYFNMAELNKLKKQYSLALDHLNKSRAILLRLDNHASIKQADELLNEIKGLMRASVSY